LLDLGAQLLRHLVGQASAAGDGGEVLTHVVVIQETSLSIPGRAARCCQTGVVAGWTHMKTIHDCKLAINLMTRPLPCKALIVIGTGPVGRKPVTEAR